MRRSSESPAKLLGCGVAQRLWRSLEGAAELLKMRRSSLGCGVAQWLVRWAAVRFPSGTPPSASRMNYLPRRRSLYLASMQAKFNPRMNIVLMYVS